MRVTLAAVLALAITLAGPAGPARAVEAPPLPGLTTPAIEARIDDLLARMTVEEKVGQLVLTVRPEPFDVEAAAAEVKAGRVGSFLNVFEPADQARLRRAARESRHGLPVLFSKDVLHGVRTIAPVPLGLAATWNPALAGRTAAVAGEEARRIGIDWVLGPTVDVARDPRWGRMVDGFGEDPRLAAAFGTAMRRGYGEAGLLSGPKHFTGYGAVGAGRDYAAAEMSPATLRDVHLPPFRAVLADGGEIVMAAFHALNGMPVTANRTLLTGVLREEWGFQGPVVSDWGAIGELIEHGLARDGAEAARLAFLAGVDIDMQSGLYAAHLADEVRAGRVTPAALDTAVRRVLRVKLAHSARAVPEPAADALATLAPTPASREAAARAAEESIVLLANDRGILPIRPEVKRIAVIGPHGADPEEHIGPLVTLARWNDATPLVPALVEALKGRATVTHEKGCDVECRSAAGFDAAVAAARDADLVVATLGEPREWTSEAQSRADLGLPGRQQELLDRLVATGKPVVLVLFQGRALVVPKARDETAAMLTVWFPGTEGGPALARVLTGAVSPSGRLPVTMSRAVGLLPQHHAEPPTGRPFRPGTRYVSKYLDQDATPLFAFGHGLGYAPFAYGPPKTSTAAVRADETIHLSVTITNRGRMEAMEVVQAYARPLHPTSSRPARQLVAFAKVSVKPGETVEVPLEVPVAELAYTAPGGGRRLDPGPWRFFVGRDSTAETFVDVDLR